MVSKRAFSLLPALIPVLLSAFGMSTACTIVCNSTVLYADTITCNCAPCSSIAAKCSTSDYFSAKCDSIKADKQCVDFFTDPPNTSSDIAPTAKAASSATKTTINVSTVDPSTDQLHIIVGASVGVAAVVLVVAAIGIALCVMRCRRNRRRRVKRHSLPSSTSYSERDPEEHPLADMPTNMAYPTNASSAIVTVHDEFSDNSQIAAAPREDDGSSLTPSASSSVQSIAAADNEIRNSARTRAAEATQIPADHAVDAGEPALPSAVPVAVCQLSQVNLQNDTKEVLLPVGAQDTNPPVGPPPEWPPPNGPTAPTVPDVPQQPRQQVAV